jgi:type IV secretion system protein VirD4
MYFVSRMILLTALAVYLYCIVIAVPLFTPYSWWALLFFGLIAVSKNRKRLIKLTDAHGGAAWSGEQELEKARMLDGKPGRLPLGRLIATTKPTLAAGIKALLALWHFRAKRACQLFFAGLRRKQQAPLVRLPPATVNSVCFAPVGAGKSTGLCIPFLLECDDSAIVIDFKGELAQKTALHRKKRMGHEIAIFDPYGAITQ